MRDAVQDRFAPQSSCFGCGPANPKGLRIKSFPDSDGNLICDWMPEAHHEAFPGMLNGGIVGALLDCHSNWAATHHLMIRDGLDAPLCTVTARYEIEMKRPTPSGSPVHLRAEIERSDGRKVWVFAELLSDDVVCATCTGLFLAVKPGHPAYHRW
jgi:acyl-coenzyme A thioesterase PaaI-like protein